MLKKNILVIGGTNFIGPFVIRQLRAMGHEVTLFHRGNTTAELPANVEQIFGDRQQLTDFKDEFARISPQVVLDMIPYTEQDARGIMQTFKGIAQRIVAISSIDVYRAYGVLLGKEAGICSVPLTEDSPLRQQLYIFPEMPTRPSGYEKIRVEQIVMGDPELPGTILRLPMVYGPNDPRHRLFDYLQRMDNHRAAIVLPESIAQWRSSYGYVKNVAHAIALAVCDSRASDRIYNVADLEVLSEAQRLEKISQVAGWPGKVVIAPQNQLSLDWQSSLNTQQDWYVDTTRIRQELGYSEIVPLKTALQETIDWQRHHLPPESHQSVTPWLLDYDTEDAILAKTT